MRQRIYYSTEQRREIWDRWKRGESAHEIGRLFDRPHSSIFKILMKTGGLRPPERRRSRSSLTLAEREEISRGLVAGLSIRSIAADLKRAASTISREIKRNGGRRRYRRYERFLVGAIIHAEIGSVILLMHSAMRH